MGSMLGVLKIAAKKAGVTFEVYQEKLRLGLKWCGLCRIFHPLDDFVSDTSRYDGRSARCRNSRNQRSKELYVPRPGPDPGRSFVPARHGDKKQARRRVNYLVEAGLIPRPSSLPCHDCGQVWAPRRRRHEYDHYLGYAAEHHEDVQCVCTSCHRNRESRRK